MQKGLRVLVFCLLIVGLAACDGTAKQELEQELAEARTELQSSRDELAGISEELAEARAEAVSFQEQAEILQAASEAIPDEVEGAAALEVEADNLADAAEDIVADQAQLDEDIAEARLEIAEMQDSIRTLTDEKLEMEAELIETRSELSEAQARIATLDEVDQTEEIADGAAEGIIDEDIRVLEVQVEELIAERDAAIEQVTEFDTLMANAQQEIADFRDAQTDLELELVTLRNDAVSIPDADQLDTLNSELSSLQSALEIARTELAARPSIAELEAAEQEMTDLRLELDSRPTQTELDALEARLETAPEVASGESAAALERRLVSACEQLAETVTDADEIPFCEGL